MLPCGGSIPPWGTVPFTNPTKPATPLPVKWGCSVPEHLKQELAEATKIQERAMLAMRKVDQLHSACVAVRVLACIPSDYSTRLTDLVNEAYAIVAADQEHANQRLASVRLRVELADWYREKLTQDFENSG